MLVIGAARQGTALARYLAERGDQVILNDRRQASDLALEKSALADLPVEWACGGHSLDLLQGVDLVCPSGGVPLDLSLIEHARQRGIPLSNDSQIFLEAAPCPVIGITGSAGKTTTTLLVGRIAERAYEGREAKVYVGGNIGNPLITQVDHMQAEDLAVMELSSFQLDLMTRSPQIAAVLNVTPNHLDRHGSMQAYTRAKARILAFQDRQDIAVLGRDDAGAWGMRDQVRGRLATFGLSEPGGEASGPAADLEVFRRSDRLILRSADQEQAIVPISAIGLRGEHNLLNVMAACAIAAAAGVPPAAMRAGIAGFSGAAHRLAFVRSWRGADWYNDSIATAPERAIAGIRSFEEPLVLLAGGRDKDLPWDDLIELICRRVDHLIAFGETAGMIAERVRIAKVERPFSVQRTTGLQRAVQAAAAVVSPGDVVLLSPGGASFDEFHDFAERGEWYEKWVMELE